MTTTGSDIEATCSKCGDVWHVVVAMVGEQVAQVQCKECGSYRKLRSKKSSTTRKRAPTKKAKSDVIPVQADLSKPVRRYSMRDQYEPGERIEHPTFGVGVVEHQTAPDKMEVRFPDSRRMLVMART